MVYIIDPENGVVISEEHRRVAELIQEYNPELFLMHIPASKRESAEDHDKPYAILHVPSDKRKEPYYVGKYGTDEINVNLIAHLYAMDSTKSGTASPEVRLQAMADAKRAMDRKRQEDMIAEGRDFVLTRLKSHKNYYHHNGRKY